ncbi:MAG: c-type cytochrome [candidate division Zixibacteria bacterium]|nr:c-type cytochrome [candidate division Zixibacteria bacterium]
MRTPPAGTVPRGALIMDSVFMTGLDADSVPVAEIPDEITMPLLERGQERFDIYCSPCHGRTGDGRGIMVNRGYVPPPTYHSDRLRDVSDGHIFNVITYGIRNMKGYKHQIPPDDRWAIIAYMRALQRSQNATLDDVPQEKRSQLRARDGS